MERWFIHLDGEAVGPLPEDAIAQAIQAGRIGATTNVCREAGGDWEEVRNVPDLARALPSKGAPGTSSALSELVGQELSGFLLTALLGEGGMAVVFQGENTLDRKITRAIKVVRPELSANPEFLRRFTEEARTLERLQHPNVVRFNGLRRDRGLLVMELELLTGEVLAERIKRAPRGLPLDEGVRFLAEASEGVAAAHALGVVHRDLKPQNLFVTGAGPLKVLDFGIARAIDEADRAGGLTQAGLTVGTPAYMAPEVCNGAKPSEGADVYALGLTLFEALTGFHPLLPDASARLSSAQVMFAQVNRPVPPLRDVRPDAPQALADVLMRAVAKDPNVRFRDAATLAAALRGVRGLLQPRPSTVPPGTRFDIPQLSGPPRSASQPDLLGQQTGFALPSPVVRPSGAPPAPAYRPVGPDTGVGTPPLDRIRTTGSAAVMERPAARTRSLGLAIGIGVFIPVVALGVWLLGRGDAKTSLPTSPTLAAASAPSQPPEAVPPSPSASNVDSTDRLTFVPNETVFYREYPLTFSVQRILAAKSGRVLLSNEREVGDGDVTPMLAAAPTAEWNAGDTVLYQAPETRAIEAGTVQRVRLDGQLTVNAWNGSRYVTRLFSPPQSMKSGQLPLAQALAVRPSWAAPLAAALASAESVTRDTKRQQCITDPRCNAQLEKEEAAARRAEEARIQAQEAAEGAREHAEELRRQADEAAAEAKRQREQAAEDAKQRREDEERERQACQADPECQRQQAQKAAAAAAAAAAKAEAKAEEARAARRACEHACDSSSDPGGCIDDCAKQYP